MRNVAFGILFLIAGLIAWAATRPPTDRAPTEAMSAEDTSAEGTSAEGASPEDMSSTSTAVVLELEDLGEPKPLVSIDGWLQADVTTLEELRGQVVVVQFWTFGCHNCKATLDNLAALYDEHRDHGLEIVGIHSPEFDYEADVGNIEAAAADLGVDWPIVLDTNKHTFFSWQGSPAYWPRTYVIDRDGIIRFDHIGEGRYDELNATVRHLLDQPA